MDNLHKNKYLKYKTKYLNLKQHGGLPSDTPIKNINILLTNNDRKAVDTFGSDEVSSRLIRTGEVDNMRPSTSQTFFLQPDGDSYNIVNPTVNKCITSFGDIKDYKLMLQDCAPGNTHQQFVMTLGAKQTTIKQGNSCISSKDTQLIQKDTCSDDATQQFNITYTFKNITNYNTGEINNYCRSLILNYPDVSLVTIVQKFNGLTEQARNNALDLLIYRALVKKGINVNNWNMQKHNNDVTINATTDELVKINGWSDYALHILTHKNEKLFTNNDNIKQDATTLKEKLDENCLLDN